MWHAFDIIADELAVNPAVRGLGAGPGHRLIYSERVVRWFSDKTGQGQWPAVVDRQPGITLERPRPVADNAAWQLGVEHTRVQTAPVTMQLTMTCESNPWRSPKQWSATESIGDIKRTRPLKATTEAGRVENGRIIRTISAGSKHIDETYDAARATSLYALLADFPAQEVDAGRFSDQPCQALFTEGMQFVGGGTLAAGVPGNAGTHELAKSLRCYQLTPAMGFPLEFWVNDKGVVVYLIEAATRAWMLQGVEMVS